MNPTRREFLAGGAAAVAGVAVGIPVDGAPIAAVELTPAPSLMAYVVGTPGEYDGMAIWAENAAEAFKRWRIEYYGGLDEAGACEWCGNWESGEDGPIIKSPCECDPKEYVTRVKRWDGKSEGEIMPGDWIDAGFGYACDRCNWEASSDDAYNVGGDAVCHGCMKLADWKVVDIERYNELIDEALTEEYGPDLRHPEYW